MGYKIMLCCGNSDCDYSRTKNVVGTMTQDIAINLANQLNSSKQDYCPKCGKLLRYYPNYHKK